MLPRTLASSLLVAAALAVTTVTGCNKKPQLTEVQVPDEGVKLRYDLTPGQEYNGSITMSTAAQTPMGDMTSIVKFNAAIVVSNKEQDGSPLLRATLSGIEATARMPEGIPAAAAGINPEAAAALNGMELRFNMDANGKISNTPEPPEAAANEIKMMIGLLTSALEGGLSLRMPPEAVKGGATWDTTSKELDENVTSAKGTGSLEGLARNEAGEDVATLAYTGESKSERSRGDQKLEVNQKVETNALFSASGGYPVTIERKINNEIVGQVTFLIEIEAEWTKGGKQDVGPVISESSADDQEVQEITDPCDPDYVGAGECADDELPAEEAPPPAEGTAEAPPPADKTAE